MELPLPEVPGVPHWLENYAWDAYDPARRILLYVHVGRWFRDPELWREFVIVCIDGREVYARRAIGRHSDPALVGASSLRMSCEEPMRLWRCRYRGPAVATTAEELFRAPLPDGDARHLAFDLSWEAACPVIDFGHGTEPGAVASHYEQGGVLRGSLAVDGREIGFDGRSFRDHSRGPRTLEPHFGRHIWVHGTFPSGRTISSLLIETPGGALAVSDLFAVGRDGRVVKHRFVEPRLYDEGDDPLRPYRLQGVSDSDGTLSVEARPQFVVGASLFPPMDLFVGQSPAMAGWRLFEMPTRLSWDGEETFGHTEFTLRRA